LKQNHIGKLSKKALLRSASTLIKNFISNRLRRGRTFYRVSFRPLPLQLPPLLKHPPNGFSPPLLQCYCDNTTIIGPALLSQLSSSQQHYSFTIIRPLLIYLGTFLGGTVRRSFTIETHHHDAKEHHDLFKTHWSLIRKIFRLSTGMTLEEFGDSLYFCASRGEESSRNHRVAGQASSLPVSALFPTSSKRTG
jgi:hypothetical protein